MGHKSISVAKPSNVAALARYERSSNRDAKKRKCLDEAFENVAVEKYSRSVHEEIQELPGIVESNEINATVRSSPVFNSVETQTDLTMEEIDELINMKENTKQQSLSESWFKADDDRVRFYTGLPVMAVLMAVFNLISPGLPERKSLTKFQQLVITLMRLRLNIPIKDIAYRFGIHVSTVSRVIQSCVDNMYTSMSFLVQWPEREKLKLTMPDCFKKKFSSCAVIIDCFEVFVERPSCLLARAQTWSSYKHHNTAKFLIGITPQGTISFISKGWGGRASDKHITENCGLLKNLLPGDLVLADRGFDIEESVGLYAAQLGIPTFTKGKPQLSPLDVETTRTLANVRIHVERVIGSVRQKYAILGHSVVPVPYLMTEDEESCLLDKIAFVCCALANCSKSVVLSE